MGLIEGVLRNILLSVGRLPSPLYTTLEIIQTTTWGRVYAGELIA